MHNFRNLAMSKVKTLVCASLGVACVICFSNIAFAQTQATNNHLKVRLGDIDSSAAPLQKILANPVLTTNQPGCEVTKFSIMILPAGGEIQGPYTKTGSRIGQNQLSMLSEFKNMKVRIFIDDVYVKCTGQDTTKVPGINLISHP